MTVILIHREKVARKYKVKSEDERHKPKAIKTLCDLKMYNGKERRICSENDV